MDTHHYAEDGKERVEEKIGEMSLGDDTEKKKEPEAAQESDEEEAVDMDDFIDQVGAMAF